MSVSFNKIVLVVLDGFGVASRAPGNAISRAEMKTMDRLVNNYPSITLQAAGPNVGLPWGEPGNSEVGHMCLGAGRIVMEDLPRIDQSINDGSFYENPVFLSAIEHAKSQDGSLHLIGMLGDGRVHASQLHLYALLEMIAARNLKKVYIHAILDGRDSKPDAGKIFVRELEKKILELGVGKIATLSGRFYAMDRAQHWDLTEAAYRALVLGQGEYRQSPTEAVEEYYQQSIFDETVPPTVIAESSEKPHCISDNDAVIIFNFRSDRGIQITQSLSNIAATGLSGRYPQLKNLYIATMTEYSSGLQVQVAFPKIQVTNVMTEIISRQGLKQYHISETEKFPHVTYFFNNGRETAFAGEEWEQVSSNQSYKDRYQKAPEMSSVQMTDRLIEKLSEPYDFYLVNFANPDMVGHTGNLDATVKALKTVDSCLERLVELAEKQGDVLIAITADHGNCEEIHEVSTGRVSKSHTTNPVPFILAGSGLRLQKPGKQGFLYLAAQIPEGLLSDVAPTILELLGIAIPKEMTGISLLPVLLRQIPGRQAQRKFDNPV